MTNKKRKGIATGIICFALSACALQDSLNKAKEGFVSALPVMTTGTPQTHDNKPFVVDAKTIKETQSRLTKLGFKPGPIDGVMGGKTRQAIIAFQKKHWLKADGEVSQSFIIRLREEGSPAPKAQDLAILGLKKHNYEGAMSSADKNCDELIEPFELSSNAEILSALAAESLALSVINKDKYMAQLRSKVKMLNWLPLSLEVKYGQSIHDDRMENDATILKRSIRRRSVRENYKKADNILAKVLDAVSGPHPYEFKLSLIDDETINAEAIPGGFIYLNTGALNNGQAEFVLAHELAHVLKRHTTKEMQARLIDSVETYDDLKNLIKNRNREQALLKSITFANNFINYSKQQELQSDACSVRIVASIEGINFPIAVREHARSLKGEQTEQGKKPRLSFSSHPKFEERAKTIRRIAKLIPN